MNYRVYMNFFLMLFSFSFIRASLMRIAAEEAKQEKRSTPVSSPILDLLLGPVELGLLRTEVDNVEDRLSAVEVQAQSFDEDFDNIFEQVRKLRNSWMRAAQATVFLSHNGRQLFPPRRQEGAGKLLLQYVVGRFENLKEHIRRSDKKIAELKASNDYLFRRVGDLERQMRELLDRLSKVDAE